MMAEASNNNNVFPTKLHKYTQNAYTIFLVNEGGLFHKSANNIKS